jgi:AcrR family transcriptional regulator
MKRLNSDDRRALILAAAAGLFAREGVPAPTARIAAAANVSEPILYRHFSSKQELFAAVVEQAGELILHDLREATGRKTAADHLKRRGDDYRVLLTAMLSEDAEIRLILKRQFREMRSVLKDWAGVARLIGEAAIVQSGVRM